MTRNRDERASDGGYILVAVLGVMLLLTGFMAAGSVLVRSVLDTARVDYADVAMSGLAQGGLELTAYQLFVVKAAPAAIEARRIKLGGGTVAPYLDDEGGKADLNGSDPKLLAAVFQGVGLEPRTAMDLLAHVVAMRGSNRDQGGVSQPNGSTPTEAKRTARGFQSVDQLLDFPELTPSDLASLRPSLTVFNPDGKINIRSARRATLMAVPGLSSAEVEVILARRDGADRAAINALLSTIQNAAPYIKTTYGPSFSVRIDATSATGRKKAVRAVIAASKSPNDPYYVLDWWE